MSKIVPTLEWIGGWVGLWLFPNGRIKPHHHWGSHTDVFSPCDVTILTLLSWPKWHLYEGRNSYTSLVGKVCCYGELTISYSAMNKSSVHFLLIHSQVSNLCQVWIKMSRSARWHSWLRHCTTSLKIMVSTPNGVRILYWPNPSGRTVNSASNRNKWQEYFLGGKSGQCIGLTNTPPSCASYLEIWKLQPPETLWPCQDV